MPAERFTKMKDLSKCREEIDKIDSELILLLEKRMRVAEGVAKYKLDNDMKVFDEERERAVLNKIGERSPEDIREKLVGTYDGIMNMSKLHQYELKSEFSPRRAFFKKALECSDIGKKDYTGIKVGVQGVDGAFSSQAARAMYPGADIIFYVSWAEIFTALHDGKIEYGVLPVENSTYGSVTDVYRLIMDNDAYITLSYKLPVEHSLLTKNDIELADIKEVLSHPQAIGQCSNFIDEHNFTATQTINTANAAKTVSESSRADIAAIASVDCAELYGLRVLEQGIQNEKVNTTRFASISRNLIISPNADKISIQFSLAHREGTLARILGYFSALGLNLTKIESRPIPSKPFEYRFFLDFNGSMRDTHTFNLICALSDELSEFRFLGNYEEN